MGEKVQSTPERRASAGLGSSHVTGLPDQIRVPGAGLGQRYRIDRSKTVYHVVPEEYRDTQAGLLHRPPLHSIAQFRVLLVIDQGADAGRNPGRHLLDIVRVVTGTQRILIELEYLLF